MNVSEIIRVSIENKKAALYDTITPELFDLGNGYKANKSKTFYEDSEGNIFSLESGKLVVGYVKVELWSEAYKNFIDNILQNS